MAATMMSRCTCPSAAVSRLSAVPRTALLASPARPATAAAWRRQSCARPVVAQAAAAEVALPPEAATPPSMGGMADTYAVIDLGGVQHIVEEGRWYTCNRLQAEPGSTIRLGRVLAHKSDGKFTAGQPYLSNVVVEAEVLEDCKGPKLIVFKHKPKKHYQRKTGHRQLLSKFMVTKIATE